MSEHFSRLQKDFATEWPGPLGPKVKLSNQYIELSIYPHDGCRIQSLKAFDTEILREWDKEKKAFQYGCFPMVPWVGRVENGNFDFGGSTYQLPQNKGQHAMHGIACMSHWDTLYSTKSKALFKLELDDPWPFKGIVLQELQLIDTKLIMKLSILSYQESFPASAGWHPWLKRELNGCPNTDLLVCFNADWQEESGDNEVPTGKRILPQSGPWDDTFGFNEAANLTIYWGSKLKMTMTSTGKYLTLFDKLSDAICVNTMTDRPNSFNSYRKNIVTPSNPLEIETIINFESS